MSRKNSTNKKKDLALTVDDLTGKQSVRATFRLPRQAIDLLSVIASQLGIKQKSLFDQLIENTSILDQVVSEAKKFSIGQEERQQKTFVISKSTLLSLNHVAKQQDVTRDILVEVYINQLLPVIETELNKHKKRKTLLKEMKTYQDQGKKLLRLAEELLSEDDMLCEKIKNQIGITNKNVATAEKIIKKGMPMEDW